MKLLLDSCVWGGAVQELRAAGNDVIWMGDWSPDPGDGVIMRYAYANHRILITLDKDFGVRAIVMGEPHAGIIRLVGISARNHATSTIEALDRYGDELVHGAIVTIGPTQIRIRPGESAQTDE